MPVRQAVEREEGHVLLVPGMPKMCKRKARNVAQVEDEAQKLLPGENKKTNHVLILFN